MEKDFREAYGVRDYSMSDIANREFSAPGRGRGLKDALNNRYLLKLLVDKEIKVRYRGSILGIFWSYICLLYTSDAADE